jgi:hypothetical protein
MTGYTVHTGASKKFVSGWDRIFSDDDAAEKPAEKTKKTEKSKTKSEKKSVKKKTKK